jgi:major membrane immunogen (membrane-anchored lipoprotein)
MKKVFALLFVAIAALSLAACGEKEYKVDGEFTAFQEGVNGNAQMVTTVTVKIEKGKIVSYYIDALQGKRTEVAGDPVTYTFTWNEKTKKELGYGYRMHDGARTMTETEYIAYLDENDKLEWFEQAELIEAKWLADGVESVTVANGVIDNVAGVTIKDGSYTKLAKEAVELAKAGKFQTILTSGKDLYFASMVVDSKGKVSELVINTLQSKIVDNVLVWNEKSKQELGADYGMKDIGPGYKLVDGAWVVDGKCDTEWNDQVAVISNYILDNGYVELKSIDGRGVSLDGTSLVDGTSSVTIKTDNYFTLLKDLFAKVA